MNSPRTTAMVFFVAIVAASVVANVGAQSPSPGPTTPFSSISEKPPQFWAAEGGNQASWMALRQRCADIGTELMRRQSMNDKQLQAAPGLSFSRDELLRCTHLPAANTTSSPALPPSTASPAIIPTPINTPKPPQFPVGPESFGPDTSGPLRRGRVSLAEVRPLVRVQVPTLTATLLRRRNR